MGFFFKKKNPIMLNPAEGAFLRGILSLLDNMWYNVEQNNYTEYQKLNANLLDKEKYLPKILKGKNRILRYIDLSRNAMSHVFTLRLTIERAELAMVNVDKKEVEKYKRRWNKNLEKRMVDSVKKIRYTKELVYSAVNLGL